jgi:uncharacterized protein (TIGR02118 family)
MIKLVYIVKRLPDMTPGDFYKCWLDDHAPLVKEVAEDIRAVRYIQSHTLDTPINQQLADSRGMPPPYDGITEVWWNSMDDLVEGMSSPEGKVAHKRLLEDEKDFIDFENSYVFITEEHVIFDKT